MKNENKRRSIWVYVIVLVIALFIDSFITPLPAAFFILYFLVGFPVMLYLTLDGIAPTGIDQ